jgi:hypothetical protein
MLRRTVMALGLGVVAMGQGCMMKADDGDKFREPIPEASDVSLSVPSSGNAGAKSAEAIGPTGTDPGYAKFYQFTRNITDGVDFVTGVILGSVWLVVHTHPTTVSDHEATWGPGNGDALSPVVWRLKVTEASAGVFDYELDGRPKASTSEGDYLAVLKGRGYGKAHPEHRNGWFVVDNDAAQTLDPARAHDHGTAKVTHHLSAWPGTIAVELRPTPDPNWVDVTVTHNSDGSGAVDLSGLTDVEDQNKDGNLEDVVMHNRWAQTGAGRADVQISGGSMPSLIKATECWSTSFYRSYYTDNVNYQPTAGDPAACAFPDAQF